MRVAAVLATAMCVWVLGAAAEGVVSVADYPSIQAAVDANPGKMILVPDGEHRIDKAIRIASDNTGLYGYGQIVQTNAAEAIVEVHAAKGVRVRDLTLTRVFTPREGGRWEDSVEGADRPGVDASECDGLELEGLRVVNNKSQTASIAFERCLHSRVRNCVVLNYRRLTIDDRTQNEPYGYAFRVIDGMGIKATLCRDLALEGNRVVEEALLPSPELKAQNDLGRLVEGKAPTKKGPLAPQGDYANNWNQGSAIMVSSPEESDFIRVTNNYIENAAQGIDLHADHIVCSNNLINGAFIGVKSMHGARNVIISNNNFSRIDLWGICLQPGTASHGPKSAEGDKPAVASNPTAGMLLANNVFSDLGRGLEHFNWKDGNTQAISLQWGPFPENPALSDVVITGNIVYDTEHETPDSPPLYKYAVFMDEKLDPTRFRFLGNIFSPGSAGVCNRNIQP
jgi:hypothetical protein